MLALAGALSGCSPISTRDGPGESRSGDAGSGDATTPSGPSANDGAAASDVWLVDDSSTDVCSPPVPIPQRFPGEVAAVDQTCGVADGGPPPLRLDPFERRSILTVTPA